MKRPTTRSSSARDSVGGSRPAGWPSAVARLRALARAALRPRRLPGPARAGAADVLASPPNPGGIFDLRIMRDVAVLTGTGVGGGSLVYANVQLRAPDAIFDDPAWPAAIDARSLRPYYDRTEEALDPRETPAEFDLPKVRAFDAMAARAGRQPSPCRSRSTSAPPAGTVQRRIEQGATTSAAQLLPADVEEHRRHHVRRPRRGARCRGLPAARGAADRPAGARGRRVARRLPRPPLRHRRRCPRARARPRRGGARQHAPPAHATAAGCRGCRRRSARASRATATRWRSRSTPPRRTSRARAWTSGRR